jgi:hypothetical protein
MRCVEKPGELSNTYSNEIITMYAPKCVPSCIAVGNDGYDVMTSSGTGSE